MRRWWGWGGVQWDKVGDELTVEERERGEGVGAGVKEGD